MATAADVAKFVLERAAVSMDTVKLQKLVFYTHAWHSVATGRPLFREQIVAHKYGPVVPFVLSLHAGKPRVTAAELGDGSSASLTEIEKQVAEAVLAYYGKMSAFALADLTHEEEPWIEARSKWFECRDASMPQDRILGFYSRKYASTTARPDLPKLAVTWVLGSEFQELAADDDDDDEIDSTMLLGEARRHYAFA